MKLITKDMFFEFLHDSLISYKINFMKHAENDDFDSFFDDRDVESWVSGAFSWYDDTYNGEEHWSGISNDWLDYVHRYIEMHSKVTVVFELSPQEAHHLWHETNVSNDFVRKIAERTPAFQPQGVHVVDSLWNKIDNKLSKYKTLEGLS